MPETPLKAQLPESLLQQAHSQWQSLLEDHPSQVQPLLLLAEDGDFSQRMARVLASSSYSAEQIRRHPEWFLALQQSGDLDRTVGGAEAWKQRLADYLGQPESVEELDAGLRRFRNREMVRIIWRDFNRLAEMEETTLDVSMLAESCIEAALDFHYHHLCESWGTPYAVVGGEKVQQRMVVLGMGKLGGCELNLSSDIDLIFCYPNSGETEGGRKQVTNQEYFLRLGQRLIKSLDQSTADGFVFRVDMRLRPYGDSGALVLNFDAMEEYYQEQGRDWERYAMIKAKVVAGDRQAGEVLMDMLRPFVYRRYIDFSAIESLRSMKGMIEREVKRRRLDNNIKLGQGGIREIEFIAQCFQLIRGGRDLELQQRSLRKVLTACSQLGLLPEEAEQQLYKAYRFLRNTEHAIQGFLDRQTQELPDADYPCAALAEVMGFVDWREFSAELQRQRTIVAEHFRDVVAEPEQEQSSRVQASDRWRAVWEEPVDWSKAESTLADAGHENAAEVVRILERMQTSGTVSRMQPVGRERLDLFMPQLLEVVSTAEHPSLTLERVLPLVESVLRRTAYLVLLNENRGALEQLVLLCASSPWIAQQLAQHPALLDELLDARSLYTVPEKAELRDELHQQMLRLPMDDLEAHMEQLRYFRLAHVLRVAASEVTERLPLMKVSDYLTWIAEVVLEHVLELAWHNLVEKYGRPQRAPGEPCDKDFIVIGYGKMGGIELGHGSDLDLVFMHDAHPALGTDGPKEIDNGVFFTRLGQRIIHILNTQTPLGQLYEVDMRLRPSGNSGLLVSSLKAFTEYQEKEAWTWEHQALVRARVVAGDEALAGRFLQVRHQILCRERDAESLRAEVVEMRQKMRDHLLPAQLESSEPPILHLKHGTGAIVDIEFMVQYAVLAWSHQHPALTRWTDNIRILESLGEEGLFTRQEVEDLCEAYKAYRARAHLLSLQQQKGEVAMAEFQNHRQAVLDKWQQLMGDSQ